MASASGSPPSSCSDFEIAILCALKVEFDAVEAAFDASWDEYFKYNKAYGDPNAYSTGKVYDHNVVLAFAPGMGKVNSANVASGLRSTFPQVKLGLIVGVCGASPTNPVTDKEIILGDVIISTGVVQSDFGRQYPDGVQIKDTLQDSLGRPNNEVRALLNKLSGRRTSNALKENTSLFLKEILNQVGFEESKYPGVTEDKLFDPTYRHKHHSKSECALCYKCVNDSDKVCGDAPELPCTTLGCDQEMLVSRKRLSQQDAAASEPCMHLGLVASADVVLKSASHRDRFSKERKIIGFEMEGAGAWDTLPIVIIKGVSDYADSHKTKKWQGYAAASAAGCMKAFLKEWVATDSPSCYKQRNLKGIAEDIACIDPKENFSVAFNLSEVSENASFVARQGELKAMHQMLGNGDGRRAVTLHGLGGIGKTQLAIAYAKAHRDDYSAIFWLNIKDEASVMQSYSRIATRILKEHPSVGQLSSITDETQLNDVMAAVKQWLEHPKNTRWLMVFDNYDNPRIQGYVDHNAVDIWRFLPGVYHGSIIVTSISSKANVGRPIRVDKLKDVRDCLQILSDASHRDGVLEDPAATKLVEELDGHPLALAAAGAYLHEISTSFEEYLQLYKSSWSKLQETSPEVSSYEDKLYSTWNLSLDRISQQNEHSAKLLRLWAYFDNQDLWFELLREGRSNGPDWLVHMTEDNLNFNEALRVLCNYGLAEADRSTSYDEVERQGYKIHGCVHSWAFHMINQEWDANLANLTLECVSEHLPNSKTQKPWVTQRRLVRHVGRCWRFIVEGRLDDDGKEWISHKFGDMYSDQGQFEEAEQMYKRALRGKEKAWGPEHMSTLDMVSSLGKIHRKLGQLDEAKTMYKRALKGYKKLKGSESTRALGTFNDLGLLYADFGQLDEAEKMYKRALQGLEEALGPEHTLTFYTVNNLGTLYLNSGRLAEAEGMLKRALKGLEEELGVKDMLTLKVVKNLGGLYKMLRRLEEAKGMLERALQGYVEAWGPEHMSTLNTVSNLGDLYRKLGQLDEAKTMYNWALEGYEKVKGLEHSSTLGIVNNLGLLYEKLGRLDDAETMYKRALQGLEEALGLEHRSTIRAADNLGNLYKKLGRLKEAETIYGRAL